MRTNSVAFLQRQLKRGSCVQTGNLCHGSMPRMLFFFFFWSSFFPVLSPRCFLSQFCLLKCLPASPSTLPHLVLIHPDWKMSISDFLSSHSQLMQLLVSWTLPTLSLMTINHGFGYVSNLEISYWKDGGHKLIYCSLIDHLLFCYIIIYKLGHKHSLN